MRHRADHALRASWPMPEMRIRAALLQTMRQFRSIPPFRVHATCPRTNRKEGRAQRVHLLFDQRAGGEADLNRKRSAAQRRQARLRQSLQRLTFSRWQVALAPTCRSALSVPQKRVVLIDGAAVSRTLSNPCLAGLFRREAGPVQARSYRGLCGACWPRAE
jgi:hypothetical protein